MTTKEQNLLQKANEILTENTYSTGNYPWGNYRLISPGKERFKGVWNWDTAFHAIGVLPEDPELAKEQLLGFFEFQAPNGQLPDVVFENGKIEYGWSKPPVMAPAAALIFEKTGDFNFIKTLYPKLVLYEQFWVNERQSDGMFYYNAERKPGESEADYALHVGYESGWDNSPRWDSEPQNFWPVDLNCYMILTYRALAKLAAALDLSAGDWQKKEKALTQKVESILWNSTLNAYTDYNFKKAQHSTVLTPASFMPLYIQTASPERAKQMHQIAKEHFLPGMPTLAYTNPAYSNNYWRGPCWLNTAYFAAKGLKNYGFCSAAQTIRNTILTWVEKDAGCIHENYDAKTGIGLCCKRFSWSSAFVKRFILEF